ncbi:MULTISPECIES: hypothetical protein [Rhodomicrobium]|uniref:hypothetical protein n=1 Tax=Rhodomicrobium TaxID=1068 RepID=UPI00159522A3|nr:MULTISPECIES: hypothetical protein [Rhodomicrobium]
MKKQLVTIAIMLGAAIPAKADETGLASIHEWKKESGRRICMAEHFHDGAGSGKTRKEAEAAAKASWASFTAFEYGSNWGRYDLAASKKLDCVQNANGWSCATTARACKRDGGVVKAKGRPAG